MKMAYIYKITCDINDKVYIGKTNLSIEERFRQHKLDSCREHMEVRPLYRAMNKYGFEHFSIEKIEECKPEEASNREQYWIGFYHGYEEGYNATKGGDGKLFFDHQAILEQLYKTPYGKEVAEQFGCSRDLVYQIAKQNNIQLKSRGQERLIELGKTIHQYTKTGEYIQSFPSTAEAARWCYENGYVSNLTGGVRSHIGEVANGKRKTAYSFVWKYEI